MYVETTPSDCSLISEQVVTGQSGSPVVRLIQDAVAVPFWLTHCQPQTHCPLELSATSFHQIAADIDLPSVHARLAEVRDAWERAVPGSHPMKRAMAAAGVDYMRTGLALLSLCLPPRSVFRGRAPATARLVAMYMRSRWLPGTYVPLEVAHGQATIGMANHTQ
jgi:hypothetical protein